MATFTSLGVGSGLDLNTIVTKLVALERQPISQMQSKAKQLQTQVSSFGQLNSLMSGVQTAANALNNPLLWSGSTVSSSDTSAVSVTASNNVSAGNYAVTVQSLANSQTLASASAFTDSGALPGSGTLTLELGAWDSGQANFSPKSGASAVDITIEATDTLSNVVEKINSAGAGVTASLITDASGVRLSLRSTATGEANGFRVTAADSDGNNSDGLGLSVMAFDPPNGATAMQLMQGSTDAKATVNGIAVTSTTNAMTGVIDGLTLNLNKVTGASTGTAVNLTANPDTASVQTAIKTFASAYNAMVTYIGNQTKYDPTSKSGGALQGDSAATNLQARLRSMVGATSGASSTFGRMSDIGLEVQRDGTLTVNQTKLDAATAKLPDLKKAFSNSDTANSANSGFARRYADLATQALGVDGTITTRTAGLQKLITKNGEDQTALSTRADNFQARLVAQYTALDANVAKLNSLSSYVTQQITNWNKSSA
jgi:flagellar hook-associated protein 2